MIQQQQLEQWQLEERSAEAYERYLVPLFFAPGAQYLIELAALKEGERVLDVACGTGIVARTAAGRIGPNGEVTGLDVNKGMLAVARRTSADIQPPIEWREGDALALPFPAAAFDVVFCQQGLQFFRDRLAALREIHRVLVPDGRLAMSVMRPIEHNPAYVLLADALERHVGPDAATMMRSPFIPLSVDELHDLFRRAGFRDVQVLIAVAPVRYPSAKEFVRQEAASSPLAGALESSRKDVQEALVHDLEGALRAHTDDQGIIFPAEIYFISARR